MPGYSSRSSSVSASGFKNLARLLLSHSDLLPLPSGLFLVLRDSATGVSPDYIAWDLVANGTSQDQVAAAAEAGEHLYSTVILDPQNYLRPEVVESLFYLWSATKLQVGGGCQGLQRGRIDQ